MLDRLLAAIIPKDGLRKGDAQPDGLTLIGPDGVCHVIGVPGDHSPAIRVTTRAAWWRIALDPDLAFGEAYMDGTLIVEKGDIAAVLDVIMRNIGTGGTAMAARWIGTVRRAFRGLQQYNPAARARRNVAHHYDLSGRLYDLFLDADRQYSCAYFLQPGMGLDAAQAAKKAHIAAKLRLDHGHKVLDIGSGWGGLAIALAEAWGADVTGITLSDEQLRLARERAAASAVPEKVRFLMQDYRTMTGRFHRIVSVGMFEHVGPAHYGTFFRKLHALLSEDGVALLHAIGRLDGPGHTNPWIARYIFPGGYTPALSEVLPAIEKAGLFVTDVEILRLHYAETLKHWRQRFLARRAEALEIYDERFCRMWEFYLAGAEMGFRHQGLMVFQIQLTKRIDTLPITRDYMHETVEPAAATSPAAARPARISA